MIGLRAAAPLLLAASTVAACSTPTSSLSLPPSPSLAAPSPSLATSLTPVPGGGSPPASPDPNLPTTTETEWGTIWDLLPGWYPLPHSAIPTQRRTGPVTAAFEIAADPHGVATTMQALLEGAGYSTEALSGPLEDGSYVIDSVGDGECRVRTSLAPAGEGALMTVLVGAACPLG